MCKGQYADTDLFNSAQLCHSYTSLLTSIVINGFMSYSFANLRYKSTNSIFGWGKKREDSSTYLGGEGNQIYKHLTHIRAVNNRVNESMLQ